MAKRRTKEIATQEDREQWLAERREKRGSKSAVRLFGQDSHDTLAAAVDQWSKYTGSDSDGPSQNSPIYFMTLKRMIHKGLNIDQELKRDEMTPLELCALAFVETSTANLLRDLMKQGLPRKRIKQAYANHIAELSAPHRLAIKSERTGWKSQAFNNGGTQEDAA